MRVTLARADRTTVPHKEPLEGTVQLSDFEARSLVPKRVNRILDTYAFVGETEGYHAQRTVEDNFRITGHWDYGEEVVEKTGSVWGHRACSVRVEQSVYERPQLKVVDGRDNARNYSVA